MQKLLKIEGNSSDNYITFYLDDGTVLKYDIVQEFGHDRFFYIIHLNLMIQFLKS